MPRAGRAAISSALAALFCVTTLAACGGGDDRPVTVKQSEQEGAETGESPTALAPALAATRNTSRIEGADPTADAAEVALATHPRFQGAKPVEAALVLPAENWQAGIAASALAGDPLRAPILLSQPGAVPGPTVEALEILQPQGGSGPADAAAYRIGDAEVPEGVDATDVSGESPAAIASAIDELRGRLTGAEPEHVLVVSDSDPAFAMPAAAWAARSGDPVFFVRADEVPKETAAALERHNGAAAYLLGPESAASAKVFRELQRSAPGIKRISADDPVSNAIAFARFSDDTFGWNLNDPGHGIVIANSDRAADAGAASALSASGTYGPLLLTDNADELPDPLREFLLSIKPGYTDDPTRALYNQIWLIGDEMAISAGVQGQIDELAELARIGGTTAPGAPVPPRGDAEEEPLTTPSGKKVK